ncbi:MAG: energy transducer TonB [Thermosulfidibacteraceae bacterium]|jgi:TonB family protein
MLFNFLKVSVDMRSIILSFLFHIVLFCTTFSFVPTFEDGKGGSGGKFFVFTNLGGGSSGFGAKKAVRESSMNRKDSYSKVSLPKSDDTILYSKNTYKKKSSCESFSKRLESGTINTSSDNSLKDTAKMGSDFGLGNGSGTGSGSGSGYGGGSGGGIGSGFGSGIEEGKGQGIGHVSGNSAIGSNRINFEKKVIKLILQKIKQYTTYPYAARVNGWEGRVVVHALVKDGLIERFDIERGSGYKVIDEEVVRAFRKLKNSREIVIEDFKGVVEIRIPVVFRLE